MSPNHKIAQKCKGSKIRHYMLATFGERIMHILDAKSKQRASQPALHADKRVIDNCLVSRVGHMSRRHDASRRCVHINWKATGAPHTCFDIGIGYIMVYCAAFGCNEGSAKGGNTSFFSFPKDATLRNRWVANMHRDRFTPAKHSRLCSLHFERSCFDRDPVLMASMGYKGARISLKPDAVPTLFPVVQRLLTPSIRIPKASTATVSTPTTSTSAGTSTATDEFSRPAYRKRRRAEVCQIDFTLIVGSTL